jgi:hypothetical protein
MVRKSAFSAAFAILMSFCQASPAHAAGPEEQLIEAVKVALDKNFNTDWSGLARCGESNGRRCRQRACRTVCRTASSDLRFFSEHSAMDSISS